MCMYIYIGNFRYIVCSMVILPPNSSPYPHFSGKPRRRGGHGGQPSHPDGLHFRAAWRWPGDV